MEAHGAFHRNWAEVLEAAANTVSNRAPEDATWSTPTFTSYWWARLSVALWIANARSVLTLTDQRDERRQRGPPNVERLGIGSY